MEWAEHADRQRVCVIEETVAGRGQGPPTETAAFEKSLEAGWIGRVGDLVTRHRGGSKMGPVITDRCVGEGPGRRVQQLPILESAYPLLRMQGGVFLATFP